MKKEKTLYEKRISWHEEGISYNGEVFEEVPLTNGEKILREKDVKQFIEEILDEIEYSRTFVCEDLFMKKRINEGEYTLLDEYLRNLIKKIKQKAGFKELE